MGGHDRMGRYISRACGHDHTGLAILLGPGVSLSATDCVDVLDRDCELSGRPVLMTHAGISSKSSGLPPYFYVRVMGLGCRDVSLTINAETPWGW